METTTQQPPGTTTLMPDMEPAPLPALRDDPRQDQRQDQRRPQVVRMMTDEGDGPARPSTGPAIFRSSPELGDFYGALALAQIEDGYGDIERTVTARIQSSRANYVIEYETLADVLAATRPFLGKHGIAFQQFPSQYRSGNVTVVVIRTRLGHKSGQWVENEIATVVASSAPQDIGIGITYMCRYATKAICGVAAHRDDDEQQLNKVRQPPPASDAPRPAQRQSERAVAQEAARQSPATGKVRQALERGGGWLIELETGFWCATRDAELIALVWAAKQDGDTIKCETTPSSDPTKYPPRLDKFTTVKV